jgi:hypothetical protein
MKTRPQGPPLEPHPNEPQHDQVPPEASEKPFFLSIQRLAERWGIGDDKARNELEKYRGRDGFIDLGSHGSRFRRKRAIIRIHPTLLEQIERDRRR